LAKSWRYLADVRLRRSGYRGAVRCPSCHADDTKVIDSRASDEGSAIRRRRLCGHCQERFTTYERLEESVLMVVKRTGGREPFDRFKVIAGLRSASKGRPIGGAGLDEIATAVEDRMRLNGAEVTATQIGLAVLDELRRLDEVVYLRFASVYKNFDGIGDFERELTLLAKSTDARS
jgi:transcriptional repressor NrdR